MLSVLAGSLALSVMLQGGAPFVGAAQVAETLQKARDGNIVDTLMRDTIVDGHRVGVALLRRVKPETNALVHDHVTEIYQIVQGSGTLATGGTLAGSKPTDLTRVAGGMSRSGQHQGGESRRITVGDVVIVPAGMPHRFSELDGEIVYMVYRFDSVAKQ
jgi:mannose-6-phosphate isomerase-like protein (cupin superfamily)